MKITVLAKNIDFCINDFLQASKKRNIELQVIDFKHLQEALDYTRWGDIVLLKSSNIHREQERDILIEYLHSQNKIILNMGQTESPIYNKYSQQYKVFNYLQKHTFSSIHYIPTFKFNNLDELKNNKKLKFPFIEKPDQGSKGEGVRQINSFDDLDDVNRTKVYQNYIQNDGDYRVVCLGGAVLGIIKRIAKKGDIRNNVAQGARVEVVHDAKIVKILSNIALQISSIFNLNICGVDIIYDKKTKQYKFLEVNSLVVWEGFHKATGIHVADEIISHCVSLYKRKQYSLEFIIQEYYNDNIAHLQQKKFHFFSRMYLFFRENTYKKNLQDLKYDYIGTNEEETNHILKNILKDNEPRDHEYRNENELRTKISKKYPRLDTYNKILFKYLFSLKIYKKDISSNILKQIKVKKLTEYYHKLYNNPEHLCKLSTLGINYLYNVNNFLRNTGYKKLPKFEARHLLKMGLNGFNNNPELKEKYNLMLYYYTHCIIGASLFYSEKINTEKDVYKKMLKVCEDILKNNYFEINIDNKVEFLVCARMMNYETDLFDIIYSECRNSLSDMGNFLIDRHNAHKGNANKKSFIHSEHRNVLFLMAFKK